MAKQKKQMQPQATEDYMIRSLHNRFGTFSNATMNLMGYFMTLGDSQEDAQLKVDQISFELFGGDSYALGYIMGSTLCRQAFFDKINAIDELTYTFMDATAKAYLIGELTYTT